jgi:hypothetical protein
MPAVATHQPSRIRGTVVDVPMIAIPMIATAVPTIIQGLRIPIRDVVRSLSLPTSGFTIRFTIPPMPRMSDSALLRSSGGSTCAR